MAKASSEFPVILNDKAQGQPRPLRPCRAGPTQPLRSHRSFFLPHSQHPHRTVFLSLKTPRLLLPHKPSVPQLALPGMPCPQIFVWLALPCHCTWSSRPQRCSPRELLPSSFSVTSFYYLLKVTSPFMWVLLVYCLESAKTQGSGHCPLEAKPAWDFWHQPQVREFPQLTRGLNNCLERCIEITGGSSIQGHRLQGNDMD